MYPEIPNHISPTLSTIEELAKQAGQITLTYFRKHFALRDKGNNLGIVTDADLASEAFIKDFIKKNYPSHEILAEESGYHKSMEENEEYPIWIIDPLDGTTNFSKGNSYYCISIAYGIRVKSQCEILLAAIAHPPSGDIFSAEKGKGCFKNGVKMEISPLQDFGQASVVTGFSSNKNNDLKQIMDVIFTFQNSILGTRINGAAALDLAQTAAGIFDGFYEKALNSWDMAAGSLLLSEANAKVTDIHGNPFQPLISRDICAANPYIHGKMMEILKRASAGRSV